MFWLESIGTEKQIWTGGFYRCAHIHTYRKQEFQKNFEIELSNCFGQLLIVY